MQKSQIHPAILQPFLDSASNAADKGQSQWFTPPDWGKVLSHALNDYRPVVVDLTCGDGSLLRAARQSRVQSPESKATSRLLGCDIQPAAGFVSADLCRFFPLLHAVDWKGDCFGLNPPWDLHWWRKILELLGESDCEAVKLAWRAHDPRLGRDTIDSTIATMMIALDRMSEHGEGFLIANEATLQRLLFAGPHCALAQHVWAHLVIEGNPMTKEKAKCWGAKEPGATPFQTGVIWFARGHVDGVDSGAEATVSTPPLQDSTTPTLLSQAATFTAMLQAGRCSLRCGSQTRSYLHTEDTVALWQATAEEWKRISLEAEVSRLKSQGRTLDSRLQTPDYNLWLSRGCIATNLSLYDTASGRVDKAAADALHELTGAQPMKLVVMRESRRALQTAAFGNVWRVCPKLQAAVTEALRQFEAERTPLYPLPKIQRLGFLDEHDAITCIKSLGSGGSCLESGTGTSGSGGATPDSRLQTSDFRAGQRYRLRSTTVLVKRQGVKVNLQGDQEAVELDGQELAFFLTDGHGRELVFMEARLREPGVTVSIIKPGVREVLRRMTDADLEPCPIDYTVQELVEHFDIPEVPDVSLVFPEQYQAHLATLAEIERLVNAA